ncbi:lysophospholipid acyltransferase family protein [Candidatus Methylomirabilis sp.]|uniref:lysophospholipid acyltransferase family protein n=1 Tax=Candidatus Methylomirabilis sp. TaxID=2032687 RepID=UPI002A5EFA85|nr:lysophospholipid acyltransferase family protein [Candidatus Methylomirabilis sp.]
MKPKTKDGVAAYLEYLLVAGLAKGLLYLPSSMAYSVGEGLAALLYRFDNKHRLIAQENLCRAFKDELSASEIAELARSSFINLGRTVVETCRILKIDRENFRQFIRIEGYEHFQQAKRRGKGIIYITAHLGSWELLPLASALMGEPLSIVTRPLDNPYLDRTINRLRAVRGTRVLAKKLVMPALVQALLRGESVGILMDQNITWKEGVFVDFFGTPACTALAPALLALRTDASVLPAAIMRCGRDRHTIVVEKEIPLIRTGRLRTDIVANTASFTRAIEAFVRREPAQWLWVHRRWKTQPRATCRIPNLESGIEHLESSVARQNPTQ